MPNYIGIDIGGTNTRIAYSNSIENPQLKDKILFPTSESFETDFSKITKYLDSKIPVRGIGISVPGKLSEDKTTVIGATNNQGYVNKPMVERLNEKYNCIVRMDNDAAAAGLGEASLGIDRKTNFIYIIWGTGVGGSIVEFKSEIPISSKIDRESFLRYWEDLFGGRRLEERYGMSPEHFSQPTWDKVFSDVEDAILVSRDHLKAQKIIFGGGISVKQSERLEKLAKKLSNYPDLPKIEISKLGEDAGLLGALQLLR